MPTTSEKQFLKRMLDLYDQLGALRRRMREESESNTEVQKLRRDSRRKINEIARDVTNAPAPGPLGTLITRYKFNKHQVIVILALLKRRLTRETAAMKGRELLALISDSSYEVLKAIHLLDPAGPLIASGVVIPDQAAGEDTDDVLDTAYHLSEHAYRIILSTFASKKALQTGSLRTNETAYRNNLKYLMDWRRLALLYQKRAAKVFNFEYWDELGLGISESAVTLNTQMQRFREKIVGSLGKTADKTQLHLLMFQKEFSIDEEQMVILVTLLFQEFTEGSCYLDVVDLLKLVSRNEEDLVRRRRMFSRKNPLLRHELIVIEETMHDKPLTGEAYLPTWVAEKMLTGEATTDRNIDSESKIRFHEFLDGLESSDDFFEGMDGP